MKKGICYLLTLVLMITALPMQVFGAEIDVVTKVVGAVQYGTDFDGKIYGEDAPQLKMKVGRSENPNNNASIEFKIILENAVFMDTKGKDFDDTAIADVIRLLSYYNGEDIIEASFDSESQTGWFGEEIMIEAEINKPNTIVYTLTGILKENNQIWVDLQSRMEDVLRDTEASVIVRGDIVADEMIYAEIVEQGLVEDDFNETANIEANVKVVGAKEYPKGFHGEIYLEDMDDLPEVKLRLEEIDRKSSEQKIMTEFTVLLDNASFVTEKGVDFKKGRNIGDAVRLAAYDNGDERVKASYDAKRNLGWFDTNKNGAYDADEVTVAAEVYKKGEIRYSVIGDLQEDDIIIVCLQSQMEGIGLDQVATVSVESDMCYLDSKIFAEIRLQNIRVDLDDEIDIFKEEPATLKEDLMIRATQGNFAEGQQIQLKLNPGFIFTDHCTDRNSDNVTLISANEGTLVYQVEKADRRIEIAGEDIEIMATDDAEHGEMAVFYVKAVETDEKGTFDSEQVSVEVGEVQDAAVLKTLELDVDRSEVCPGESWKVDGLSIMKRDDFSENDVAKLELSEGFTFVYDKEELEGKNDIVLHEDECKDDTIVFSAAKAGVDELELEKALSIAASEEVGVGDRAILTFSVEGYTSASSIAAIVIVAEVETGVLELDVEPIQIEANGNAAFEVLGVDRGTRFNVRDEVTLTLSEGFSFVKDNEFYDGDGTEIKVKEWSKNQIVVLAPKNPGFGFDMEELMIVANEGLAVGKEAKMKASMKGYESEEKVVAVVVEDAERVPEANGKLSLKVKEIQVKAGEDASFEELGILKETGFTAGEEIALKLSKGFSFVKDNKFYDGNVEIQVKEWDENKIVVVAPEDPGRGFDFRGLIIAADNDLDAGEEAVLTAKMDGCAPAEAVIAVVAGEPAAGERSGLILDVKPIDIVAGDESSYELLGIDRTEEFTEGDKVTVELSEGFSFVENDKFYDGDGTRIYTDTWSKNEVVLLAPRDPGMGFDIEELTIVADEGLEIGKTATMTVSMAGYASVTKKVATVVETRASADVTMLGDVTCDGKVSAKDLLALTAHVDRHDRLKDDEALANADVTKDGRITIADVKKLARYIGKIIDEL